MRNVVYGENIQSICCACGAADETVETDETMLKISAEGV